jgi:Outer membrane protein beta-barrel domain
MTNLSGALQKPKRTDKGPVLRKFALLTSACTVLIFAGIASAQQQVDIMVGGATLMSSAPPSDVVSFQPLAEKNSTYLSIGGDVVGSTRRLGINVESSWRYRQGNYYGYENYRPILTDVNALFQPKVGKRLGADFMGGVGIATNRFNLFGTCSIPGCINYTSSNHLMEDLGAGIRYRVWRHFFVRPEAHYYHIQNNLGFNSNNVFRVGASVGYTIGPK